MFLAHWPRSIPTPPRVRLRPLLGWLPGLLVIAAAACGPLATHPTPPAHRAPVGTARQATPAGTAIATTTPGRDGGPATDPTGGGADPPDRTPPHPSVPTSPNTPATVLYRVHTTAPVIYLTADDGNTRTHDELAALAATGIPLTAFPVGVAVTADPAFWRKLQTVGGTVQTHTHNHPDLTRLRYTAQKHQICQGRDDTTRAVGTAPTLFRPPYGAWNTATRQAAAACGFTHLILWRAVVSHGHITTYPDGLRPGDIVLMHFTANFVTDLHAIAAYAAARHLHFASLTTALADRSAPKGRAASPHWVSPAQLRRQAPPLTYP